MAGFTVKDLYNACVQEMRKGNGGKRVLISADDEGNGYHGLFYLFTDNPSDVADLANLFHDDDNPNEVVILG